MQSESGAGSESDHFLAFVERVAADMDATPRDGKALAADAGFSRFHFDRVIEAIGGETPTRFVARVLLERAAHRLTTTDDPIIDVGLEAGYGSREAFSRAFSRAYGKSPSVWRERPGRFQLETPNGVHFHPIYGLRVPARARTAGSDVLVQMVRHHAETVGLIVDRLARLTDAQLDAPLVSGSVAYSDGASLREVVSRLIGQMAMWNAAMTDSEYDFAVEEHESRSSMRERSRAAIPAFVERVTEVAREGRFDDTFVDAFSPHPTAQTFGAMAAHVLYFGGHHRLLAISQLSSFGIADLDYGDPKGWMTRGL